MMPPKIGHRFPRVRKPFSMKSATGWGRSRGLRFEPLEERHMLSVVSWTGGGDGKSWSDAANWSGGALPGAAADVVINAPTGTTIVHASGDDSINSLTSASAFTLSGGSLTVAHTVEVDNTFTLDGGTLAHATVLRGNGGQGIVFTTSPDNTLDGVKVNTDLDLTQYSLPSEYSGADGGSQVTIKNGLTLNGIAYLGKADGSTGGTMTFQDGTSAGQVFTGDAVVLFGGGSNSWGKANGLYSIGTLTIATGVLIHGKNGQVSSHWNSVLVNEGTISADTVGGTIEVGGAIISYSEVHLNTDVGTVCNEGEINAVNGGTLALDQGWINSGTIIETGSTVELGGSFTPTSLGTFNRNGGTVNLTGILDNTNSTMALNAATGSWNLEGGTLKGGVLNESDGARLVVMGFGCDGRPNTLDGVTVNGDLDLSQYSYGASLTVKNGLVLNGNAYLGDANGTTYGEMNFGEYGHTGSQTLSGTANVVFGGRLPSVSYDVHANGLYNRAQGGTLTLGSEVTIHGKNGEILYYGSDSSLVNQGTISADSAGGTISVSDNGANLAFHNLGTLRAVGSGTLQVGGCWDNAGTIIETNSTLNLDGSFTSSSLGTINRTGGTINLTGTLNNTGSTLALNATTGSWNLSHGTLKGGVLTESDGAKLVITDSGTFDGVTVNGDLDLSQYQQRAWLGVYDGLVVNGTVYLGKPDGSTWGQIHFYGGSQTLSGNADVVFGGGSGNFLDVGAVVLTLDRQVTIHGKNGRISGNLINMGTIRADTVGGTITVGSKGTFTNDTQGMLQSLNGGILEVAGTWGNNGTIATVNSTINLGGSFTPAAIGIFNRGGGTVNLTGTLDTTGTTLLLNAATGSWNLKGGTLKGGTLTESDGTLLVISSGTLDGVIVNGDLDLSQYSYGASVTIKNNLVLNGTAYLGNADGTTYGRMYFGDGAAANQTLSGNANVLFGGCPSTSRSNNGLYNETSSGTLTLAAGVIIHGKNGQVSNDVRLYSNGVLVNQGMISADTADGTIELGGVSPTEDSNVGTVYNQGLLQAANGGSLTLGGIWSNSGTINETDSTVNLGGAFTTSAIGTLSRTAGSVNVTGTLDNTDSTLKLDALTGSWGLSGTLKGGVVTESGGAELVINTPYHAELDGVTINGNLDLSNNPSGAAVTILNGLVLNGTVYLGSADGGSYGEMDFQTCLPNGTVSNETFSGSANVVFGGNSSNRLWNHNYYGYNPIAGATLTLGAGVTIHGKNGAIQSGANGIIVNQGTISADTAGGTIHVGTGGALSNQGSLLAIGGTLAIDASVSINGTTRLACNPAGTIMIAGNLMGDVENPALFTPQGSLVISGHGTATAPQFLEVMGRDVAMSSDGFANNFAYGTLALANSTYVRLADQSRNSGSEPEALFINALIVPAGTTLDIGDLNVYVRTFQLDGTVLKGKGTIQQVPSTGPVQLSIADAAIVEGMTATLTITLSRASTEAITVAYSTIAGTATDDDFAAITPTTLTFAPGELSKTITVNIAGDDLDEGTERFSVVLSDATGAVIGKGTGTVCILDDDARVSVADTTTVRPTSGQTMADFVVTLSRASEVPVTVAYATSDASALAERDYLAQSGTLTFAPGETSKTVSVTCLGVTARTECESFTLNLSSPTNGIVADGQAQATLETRPDLVAAIRSTPHEVTSGQSTTITWTVTNIGNQDAKGTWAEAVYLTSDGAIDGQRPLAVFVYTDTLSPNASSLVRCETVPIPAFSPAGDLRFVVCIDCLNELFELNEDNNSDVAQLITTVPAKLTLTLLAPQVPEDAGNSATRAVVTRNGDLSSPLTVTFSTSDPTRVVLPLSVEIPAGQASAVMPVNVVHDYAVTGTKTVTITAKAASFPNEQSVLQVLDVDKPSLTLSLDTAQLVEGSSAVATVSRDFVTDVATTVWLTPSLAGQLTMPASVTIPAGEASVTFLITAVDDQVPARDRQVTINAASEGCRATSTSLDVLDNDMPTLLIELPAAAISEGDGPMAMLATLRRTDFSLSDLTVRLSSSNTGKVVVPAEVVIPAWQTSVTFYVGAADNALVDGPAVVTLSAVGVIPSCGCSATNPTGTATAVLTVNDDDGPSLRVAIDKAMIPEGVSGAATLTISRNTAITDALTVTLASSDPQRLVVPAIATIPAGSDSVQVPIDTIGDGVSSGDETVTITASSADFISATTTVVVTDVDRPDLIVAQVSADAGTITGQYFNVTYRVENDGLATAVSSNADPANELPGSWVDQIYLSSDPYIGGDIPVGSYTFTGTMPSTAGSNYFQSTLPILAPAKPGDYWVVVQTDAADTVREGLEANNYRVSSSPIHVQAAYSATVQATVKVAPAGTKIPLIGQAYLQGTTQPAPFVPVSIHITVRGFERVISAITDAQGQFVVTWQPLPNEAGEYTIGAAHPGSASAPAQDSFELFGLQAEPPQTAIRVIQGQTASATVTLRNMSDVPLTGLWVEVVDGPASLQIDVDALDAGLDGLATQSLSFSVTATDASVVSATFKLRIHTAEAPTVDVPVQTTVVALQSHLVPQPASLAAGMLCGKQSLVELSVKNEGGKDTGPIDIELSQASWLSLVTPGHLDNLKAGDSTSLTLQLLPPSDLPLGDYTGVVLLHCADGTLEIPFEFRALSEATGNLSLVMTDEYTYFAEGTPYVAGATVSVTDAVNGNQVYVGTSDAQGRVAVTNLREGYYNLQVDAEKHRSFRATILIDPGQTKQMEAFLPRELVTYTWSVVSTEIEDRTTLTLETTFETNVPAPVVTIDPGVIDVSGLTQVGQQMQVLLTITNHGLIAAEHLKLSFGEHPFYTIDPLISEVAALPAKGSLVIPAIIRRTATFENAVAQGALRAAQSPDLTVSEQEEMIALLGSSPVPCQWGGNVVYDYVCGQRVARLVPIAMQGVDCDRSGEGNGGTGGGGGSTGGGGGGGGGSVVGVVPTTSTSSCSSSGGGGSDDDDDDDNDKKDDCKIADEKLDLSGTAGWVGSKIVGLLKSTIPGIKSADAKIAGSLDAALCCNFTVAVGVKLDASVSIEWDWGVIQGLPPVTGMLVVPGGAYKIYYAATLEPLQAALKFGLAGGGSYDRGCDGAGHWCVGLEGTGRVGLESVLQVKYQVVDAATGQDLDTVKAEAKGGGIPRRQTGA